jgi:undecaprenyl diphosphate synthase
VGNEQNLLAEGHDDYPDHIGIIMDGNGRWATKRGLPRTSGHYEGVKAAKRVTEAAAQLGISYLTYYVFSTENWRRPEKEITYLMNLLATRLYSELDFYQRVGARVLLRGDIARLSVAAQQAVTATEQATSDFSNITVTLAINHGGQDEIVRSVNRWLNAHPKEPTITASDIREHLDLSYIPPVDLIIRSGGEQRLSNFMLWDAAYAELLFSDILWPDWNATLLQEACNEYAYRSRRFGGV